MSDQQTTIDQANADFWDELCGSTLAERIGVTDDSPESLERFDRYYLGEYPYLDRYLPEPGTGRERLLEIGLGYGTVSQILAERGFDYHGMDIAPGPVGMVRHRLRLLGVGDADERVRVASVLESPHPDESFDQIVTIGCLHHTGDLAGAIGEVRRMLRPGGRALIMVYNRRSFRRFKFAAKRMIGLGRDDEDERGAYDRNVEGVAAPATEYLSVAQAREVFADFSELEVRRENFDDGDIRGVIPRRFLLGAPAHIAGLDLYITATK